MRVQSGQVEIVLTLKEAHLARGTEDRQMTTIRRNAHKKIDALVAHAVKAVRYDHGDMGGNTYYAAPEDARGALADWKDWTKGGHGEDELVLWLSWHMNLMLEYVLDRAALTCAKCALRAA